jgi:hypothetical protein
MRRVILRRAAPARALSLQVIRRGRPQLEWIELMYLQTTPLQVGTSVSGIDSRELKSTTNRLDVGTTVVRSFSLLREATEILVPDSRAELSPAQSVERKLTSMLRGAAIPVSHIRLARLCGKR